MRIRHSSGEEYDLSPGTHLEITRYNPFFNEYGEQSLPTTLPPTQKNRTLLHYPDDIEGISKQSQRENAIIEQGVFAIPCRQALLTGNKRSGIETSFYLNTGAFYEKVKDVQLSTIFENKVITFPSVSEAIEFCRDLYVNPGNPRFACFPASVENGTLNALNTRDQTDGYPRLYNEEARTMTVDEKEIRLESGYFISPFIRGNYLLEEIFAYFGYSMVDNFFTTTEPFSGMVFLNNTIDTLMNAEIRYSQIIPDCSVNDILNIYRIKFCCEFVPDEARQEMNVAFFKDAMAEEPAADITNRLVGNYTVNHPELFKQLRMTSESITPAALPTENNRTNNAIMSGVTEEANESLNLIELLKKYPEIEYIPISGELTRTGYKGTTKVVQRLGFITMNYQDEGSLEIAKKDSPDSIPVMTYRGPFGSTGAAQLGSLNIYIGKNRALNSKIVLDSVNSDSEEVEVAESNDDLRPMICFVGRSAGGKSDFGTIMNYDVNGNKLWNYTLAYHGQDGLFERFWRNYDMLLRNSLYRIDAKLLLDEVQKVSLSEYKKVLLDGQQLIPNQIKYTPESNYEQESEFYTTKLYEPISAATSEATRINKHVYNYYWAVEYTRSNESDQNRRRWIYKEEPTTFFFAPPTAAQYDAGGRYHQRTFDVTFYRSGTPEEPVDTVDGTLTVWFEPKLK